MVEALKYYQKDEDLPYLVALSLAAISEEITGKLLIAEGKENALQNEKKGFTAILKILNKREKSDSEIHNFLNKAKTDTKHKVDYLYLDPKAEAENMLDRAIKNFERYHDIILEEANNYKSSGRESINELIKRVSSFKPE